MKITLFGATGSLGGECLKQSLEAGHEVTVLVRSADKLPAGLRSKISVVQGDGLNREDVEQSIPSGTEAIVFAIGVDKHSPQNLCADITRNIVQAMHAADVRRLVWCGGGSTLVAEDSITLGARIVEKIALVFMSLRHNDKTRQYEFLKQCADIDWVGVRPLQMRRGARREDYRLGFDRFSGLSTISFADCAHAMQNMLTDNTWLGKAPIIQY